MNNTVSIGLDGAFYQLIYLSTKCHPFLPVRIKDPSLTPSRGRERKIQALNQWKSDGEKVVEQQASQQGKPGF